MLGAPDPPSVGWTAESSGPEHNHRHKNTNRSAVKSLTATKGYEQGDEVIAKQKSEATGLGMCSLRRCNDYWRFTHHTFNYNPIKRHTLCLNIFVFFFLFDYKVRKA